MATYNINFDEDGVLQVSFGDSAQGDEICRDVKKRLDEMVAAGELAGGEVIRINGPGSLPVALVIAHVLAHRYQAVAWYVPMMKKYVVGIAHGDRHQVGDTLD